jgi:ABC-type polysaccharide/polyol phosphate export permease
MMRALIADVRDMVSEQVQYKDLLVQLTKRDLLLRYKQTAMGFGWAVFMPLVNTAVFSVIFTRVAPIDTGIPYPLFAFCGLVVWNFTASSLKFSLASLTSNPNLVTKVYFPREVFPFAAVIVSLVDSLVAALLLVVLMAWYGIVPSAYAAAIPLIAVVQIALTAGLCMLLAMANLFYRDVKYLFEVVLAVAMFSTSVLYPVSLVGGRTAQLMALNPMTPIIDGYRAALFYGTNPFTPAFVVAAAASLLLFALAWLIFHRAEFTFAENI